MIPSWNFSGDVIKDIVFEDKDMEPEDEDKDLKTEDM